MNSIPSGWERVVLADLVLPIETTRPDERPTDEFMYIDISSIDRASKRIVGPQRVLGAKAPSRARQVVRAGDVLISTVRPNLRTIAVVSDALDGQIASTGFCVLRPGPMVSSEFLFYAVIDDALQQRIQAKARGISYPAVRPADILGEKVIVPPLAAQHAIVQRVRAALADIRVGTVELDAALRELETLEAGARSAAADSAETVLLSDVAEVQSGIAKGRARPDASHELPYIRTANVQAGWLDLGEIKMLLVTEEQIARHTLRTGDVLVLEGGDADKVGRGWIWADEIEPCLHQNHVFAVRSDVGRLDPKFLAHYINAPQARAYFAGCAKQTTNLASINKGQLKALPVPDLPVEEQRERAAQLDALFEETRMLRDNIGAAAARAAELERRVISDAVRGTSAISCEIRRDEAVRAY